MKKSSVYFKNCIIYCFIVIIILMQACGKTKENADESSPSAEYSSIVYGEISTGSDEDSAGSEAAGENEGALPEDKFEDVFDSDSRKEEKSDNSSNSVNNSSSSDISDVNNTDSNSFIRQESGEANEPQDNTNADIKTENTTEKNEASEESTKFGGLVLPDDIF